jgi:hypothetical protein
MLGGVDRGTRVVPGRLRITGRQINGPAPPLRERIRQIENTALNTLASLPEAQRLSDYLWVGRSSAALLHFRTVRAFRAQVLLRSPEWESGRAALGGLAILEACCFVGAAGGVAGAVGMSAGAR